MTTPSQDNIIPTAVGATTYTGERAKQEAGSLSESVQANAGAAQSTAQDLAAQASASLEQGKAQASAATTQLQEGLQQKTNEAAVQGHTDIQGGAGGYVEQAQALATSALGTASTYVGIAQQKLAAADGEPHTGVIGSLQTGAGVALETTKSAIAQAQAVLAPHAQAVSDAAAPHVQTAKDAVQPHIDAASNAAAPHVQTVKDTVQPHVDAAANAAAPHIQAAKDAAAPHLEALSRNVQNPAVDSSGAPESTAPVTAGSEVPPTTTAPSGV